jgi:hypothetical protein
MNVRDFLTNLFPFWICWLGQQIVCGIELKDAMLVKPFVPDLSLCLLHMIWTDPDIWIFVSTRGNWARFQKMISMRISGNKSSKLRRSSEIARWDEDYKAIF